MAGNGTLSQTGQPTVKGRFAAKGGSPRRIRSMRLTDECWEWLEDQTAKAEGCHTKADYLEMLAASDEGSPPAGSSSIAEAMEVLANALQLKANAGGAIKSEIRRAMEILSQGHLT
jgi:hypothetical protein